MNASEPNAARAPRYPLARLSPAKDELLAIEITRESVDQCDIQPMLEKLEFLSETREGALLWEGKLAVYFAGWDRDPRETAEIPEIRVYFRSTDRCLALLAALRREDRRHPAAHPASALRRPCRADQCGDGWLAI